MTWFRADDTAYDHPKIKALSDKSFRWWFIALSYSSRYLTNGKLPKVFWRDVPKAVREELSKARLWDWIDPDFQIHDYGKHQNLKEEVEADKERNREKARAYRERKKAERHAAIMASMHGTPDGVTGDVTGDEPGTLPVTHPGDVTNPDNRLHITPNTQHPTPNRGVGKTPTLIAPGEGVHFDRRHGRHVDGFCDWVCLDQGQVDEFAAKIPGADLTQKREQIRLWASAVRDLWADRLVPDGSHFDFWRNRWTEQHGGSRPANATLKAARAAHALDEAFR